MVGREQNGQEEDEETAAKGEPGVFRGFLLPPKKHFVHSF